MSDVVCNHPCFSFQFKMQCVSVRVHCSHLISLPRFPSSHVTAHLPSCPPPTCVRLLLLLLVLLCSFLFVCVCCVRLEEREESRKAKLPFLFPLFSFVFCFSGRCSLFTSALLSPPSLLFLLLFLLPSSPPSSHSLLLFFSRLALGQTAAPCSLHSTCHTCSYGVRVNG